jgi:hypothetical protein
MPLVIGVLVAALGGCTGAKVNSRAEIPTIVVVTRHADTDPGSGVLNATGRERAQALADLVAPIGVTAIYSPDLERNLATVEPLARLSGVQVTRKASVSVFSAGAIVEEILERHAGGVVVWVGQRVGEPAGGLRPAARGRYGPVEYGDLHILTIPPSGPVRVGKLRYGP